LALTWSCDVVVYESEKGGKSDSINCTPVSDLDHPNGQLKILYRVNNAVIPLTNAVLLLAGELFTTSGARILGQGTDSFHDPLYVAFLD